MITSPHTLYSDEFAKTVKTIHSYTQYNGRLVSFYDLYEVAVNDSLVLRNGVIVTYRVESGPNQL